VALAVSTGDLVVLVVMISILVVELWSGPVRHRPEAWPLYRRSHTALQHRKWCIASRTFDRKIQQQNQSFGD
jgi:hypothetical protein